MDILINCLTYMVMVLGYVILVWPLIEIIVLATPTKSDDLLLTRIAPKLKPISDVLEKILTKLVANKRKGGGEH